MCCGTTAHEMGRLAGFVVKGVRDQRKNGEVWHPEPAHNGNPCELTFSSLSNLSVTSATLPADTEENLYNHTGKIQ